MNLGLVISQNWPTVLSLVIALVAILVAVYFGIRSTKSKSPFYLLKSSNIVKNFDSKVKSIQILKDNKQIKNLTVTKIFFWNGGRDSIKATDVATKDPIRFEVSDGNEILEYKILGTNDPISNFDAKQGSKTQLVFTFEFLARGKGAAVQVFHTGTEINDYGIHGTLTTGQKPKPKKPTKSLFRSRKNPKQNLLATLLAGIILVAIGIFAGLFLVLLPPQAGTVVSQTSAQPNTEGNILLAALFGLTYGLLGVAIIVRYLMDRLPSGLDTLYFETDPNEKFANH